jgi:ABC-2 type transport system ATP-binding protein
LTVDVGECFGLLGPNGAGKTTAIEIIEGLAEPTSGDVEVLGMHWREQETAIKERIGITLQDTKLSEKLTVRETVILFRSFYRHGPDPDDVIKLVSLEEKSDARVGKLSGGQQQRLAVACALVGDPELLFLDEPTTGLDPQSRRQLWDLIRDLRARGRTVLLTTHYMDEAERLCDRVAVIDHGKVIALGTPRELIARLGGDHVIDFTLETGGAEPAIADLPAVRSVRRDGEHYLLSVTEPHVALPALLARLQASGHALAGLSTRHASLEDVFVTLTGRRLRDGEPTP